MEVNPDLETLWFFCQGHRSNSVVGLVYIEADIFSFGGDVFRLQIKEQVSLDIMLCCIPVGGGGHWT